MEELKRLKSEKEELDRKLANQSKEIDELGKKLTKEKQSYEENKRSLIDCELAIAKLEKELSFDINPFKGLYKESKKIGSVTSNCRTHIFKRDFTLGINSEEYYYKGDNVKGIEFIDCWGDESNGVLELDPINRNELKVKCTSQPFRGYHWEVKIYY